MKKLQLMSVIIGTLAATGSAVAARPTIQQEVLRQTRQYLHIRTIHFLAVGHYRTTLNGKASTFTSRYSYWGEGVKFRIDFRQFVPGASFDVLITDNGRHYRYFDRIGDELRVMHSHPTRGESPDIQNPILEPLIFLVPGNSRWHWLNLARFARNPQSVLRRCFAVKICAASRPARGGLHGCVFGSISGMLTRFDLTIGAGKHGLVDAVLARKVKGRSNLHLYRISYRSFRTPSGRVLKLPTAFEEEGSQGAANVSVAVAISHIVIDRPIPPGKFTINYKLAKVVVDETHPGKWKYVTVQPSHPAPGGVRNLK
jgi:hypothetical protein